MSITITTLPHDQDYIVSVTEDGQPQRYLRQDQGGLTTSIGEAHLYASQGAADGAHVWARGALGLPPPAPLSGRPYARDDSHLRPVSPGEWTVPQTAPWD